MEMENPQTEELKAANFLHKLIQESKDDPTKLAAKLYGSLQHMRSSGKENSVPYQVISRAMETVIKQHSLDIETLMSSRLPLATVGDSGSLHMAGSSQHVGVSKESNSSFSGNEVICLDQYASTMVMVPCTSEHDLDQGPAARIHELPNQMPFSSSPYDTHDFTAKMAKDRGMEVCTPLPSMDHIADKTASVKPLEHRGSGMIANSSKAVEGSSGVLPRDTGKSPVSHSSHVSFPFKTEQLKQLRAQCIIFLSFRNGNIPRKLHLEIALGNLHFKEESPLMKDKVGGRAFPEVAGEGEMQTSAVPQMPQHSSVEGSPPSRRGRGRPRRVLRPPSLVMGKVDECSKVDTTSTVLRPDSRATFRSIDESLHPVGQPVTPISQPSLSCAIPTASTPESCYAVKDDDFNSLSLGHP